MKYFKWTFIGLSFIISCTPLNNREESPGEGLSKTYCGSCHLFPEPALLDKRTWKDDVLPPMAKKLGIDYLYETPLPAQNHIITVEEWREILTYYLNYAPDTMPAQQRDVVKAMTNLFIEKIVKLPQGNFPSTSFVKIDEGNHWIYAASTFDSSLNIYNQQLNLVSHNKVKGTVVDLNFNTPLLQAGKRNGIFTDIGIMNPNDRSTGSVDTFDIDEKGNLTYMARVFDSIPRPVQITKYDLDSDGKQDYLVCGFGNTKGAFYWMRASADKGFEKKILSPLPGAIKAYINDLNNDGLPDIIVLMAQAQEGIFLFVNKGNGIFEAKKVLDFPPIYGSSFFELIDFNNDGYKDLLYTCGDNGDYSSKALKYYHGVYIYLNDKKNNFSQKYFFPIHGCYKALARDFDKDGDLDIAAISFFPDTKNQPQESFIYLEQTTAFHFTPFTINAFDEGSWMTMDAGDVDGDGYEDIVLGSLIPPIPGKIEAWKKGNKQMAVVLLLHNKGGTLK
ncbi:MAG: VCBS repeat-containing protein [Ginsengibacter sp.]